MASLTSSFCPHCQAQVLAEEGPDPRCPSCGQPVNGPGWFYARDRQKIGPVSPADLQRLAASGQLWPTDMVLQDGAKKWVTAGTLLGLFPPADSTPTVAAGVIPVAVAVHNSDVANPPVARPHDEGLQPETVSALPNLVADGTTSRAVNLALDEEQPIPAPLERIGRYRVVKVLGEGAFGRVYLAQDDELHRPVAIKVPHRHRIAKPEDAEAYLAEARVLASLDHPHIVPVFDVGRTDDGLCFVVSKLIEGSDLAGKLKQARLSVRETASLIATLADALHHAHQKRLVHRDIKPANILIDTGDKPYLADFGLALKEGDFDKEGAIVGTPAYMSPEQARGEGHRVDGRSDIFSLGVVLYELLTGRRPFAGESVLELLMRLVMDEPCPPRQVDDTVPKELERICLKAMAKRASERYAAALDLAEDLRHWKSGKTLLLSGPTSPVNIVPKGLRSFDANDADFFLELLPGPRDRDGLPESLRFWKSRIEEKDAEKTFSVGLIYGPSGCGKSSLVKAGLLPRLADHVVPIYIEATAEETETRLLKGLRKKCPGLPASLGLAETLALLRRGQGITSGKKVLLVIDQFEQWLHARKREGSTELVQALRHCDGERVQAVLMVRDDFWMAATRLMKELEIPVVENQNFAAVDLFDLPHAKKVLTAFGRAFGAIPDAISPDKDAFLDRAVAGLAQDDKIISVRLALFAEMVKAKPWTAVTLEAVGGTEGVGVTFLEETFVASTAPPQHRLHQKAAQAVLKALLPEADTDIRGHMQSRQALLEASGYSDRTTDFEELLRILDGELRLITPTDPEGVEARQAGEQFYQLTHDYLVHSLREWLTRKQKETKRGRAELLLADRAAIWNARPENRQLPSLLQYSQIRWLTQKQHWSSSQQKMMGKASRYHAIRGGLLAALLLVATLTGLGILSRFEAGKKEKLAEGLVGQIIKAETTQVPGIIKEMKDYRTWTGPLLRKEFDNARDGSVEKLHVSLALLPVDPSQAKYLYGRLLHAQPQEVLVIREALQPHHKDLLADLWKVVEKQDGQHLQAAAALALYDPSGSRWDKVSASVVAQLVKENPVYLGTWLKAFRPIKRKLGQPLAAFFADHRAERSAERAIATSMLDEYATDQPDLLATLLMDADEKQFASFFPKVETQRSRLAGVWNRMVTVPLAWEASQEGKERLAKRQANAAVALLRVGATEKVWPLLKQSADPRSRSYLIHRLVPFGANRHSFEADPRSSIVKRLDEEKEKVSVRRALLLGLGELGLEGFADRDALFRKVEALYRNDLDAGVHGAAEWLLRKWRQQDRITALAQEWMKKQQQREEREKQISGEMAPGQPRWYVNGQGQTIVVIPGPVEFLMGSPFSEPGRAGGPNDKTELKHKKRIERSFAIASKEVTVAQFIRFRKEHDYHKHYSPSDDHPINSVSWYEAAAYCNWLSKQEDIPEDQWCYEPDEQRQYGSGMKLARDYLKRTGYRLPSESEWEYACRAGALTSRHYGAEEDLLGHYAWYAKNSNSEKMLPVASLKPNDLGLFDMYGNALEWCQEFAFFYKVGKRGEASRDAEDTDVQITNEVSRVMRGGSFNAPTSLMRSASRINSVPAFRYNYFGFRLARTFR